MAGKADLIGVLESAKPMGDDKGGPGEEADEDVMLATHLEDFKAALESGDTAAAAAAFRAAVAAC